jgi:hypothetical protein
VISLLQPGLFSFRLHSTAEAARLLHDTRIGRVGVFHLFRLPVDNEDAPEAHIADVPSENALSWISTRENDRIAISVYSEAIRLEPNDIDFYDGLESTVLLRVTPKLSLLQPHFPQATTGCTLMRSISPGPSESIRKRLFLSSV